MYHCENCGDYASLLKEETENHEVQCVRVRTEFEPVVLAFQRLLHERGIVEPKISWEGSYSSSNHGMNYHPYRYLRLEFSRNERVYEFEFSSDPPGYGHYEYDCIDAEQMLGVVLARIGHASQESLEGVLERGEEYDWEVGYMPLEDFLCEHAGKKIRIQIISD